MPRKVTIYTEKECSYCHKIFKHSIDSKKRKYCGYSCAEKSRIRRIILTCIECGKEFEKWSFEINAKFCSLKCKHKNMTSNIIICKCKNCDGTFLRKEHLLKRGTNIFCTKKCADQHNSGRNHYEWKENLHDKNLKTALKQWSNQVKERDNFCCLECGDNRIKVLEAHHVKDRSSHPKLIFDLNNGITLCLWCHFKKHKNDQKSSRLIMFKINNYGKVKEKVDSIRS